jgi:tetratricopeptide (TPR) repeat protein
MSPRPVDLPESEFAAAVRAAREGRIAEAMETIERLLEGSALDEARSTAAAMALAEVARQAENAGDLDRAEQALERAAALRPHYADLHFQHACVLLAQKRRPLARRALDQAIRLNPRYLAARVERALLDAREGLIVDAIGALRSLERELPPADARAFHQGLRCLEQADWDTADALIKRALQIANVELNHRLEEVRASLERGDAARAREVLSELIGRHPAYPDLHHLMGIAELALGHHDDALVALASALELNPDFHDARILLARALEGLGQTAQAGDQIALVLQHDPQNPTALELKRAWDDRASCPKPRRRDSGASRAAPPSGRGPPSRTWRPPTMKR